MMSDFDSAKDCVRSGPSKRSEVWMLRCEATGLADGRCGCSRRGVYPPREGLASPRTFDISPSPSLNAGRHSSERSGERCGGDATASILLAAGELCLNAWPRSPPPRKAAPISTSLARLAVADVSGAAAAHFLRALARATAGPNLAAAAASRSSSSFATLSARRLGVGLAPGRPGPRFA